MENSPQSNVDRLRQAGVLSDDPAHLHPAHEEAINALSPQEVDTLVQVRRKLDQGGQGGQGDQGRGGGSGQGGGAGHTPWIF